MIITTLSVIVTAFVCIMYHRIAAEDAATEIKLLRKRVTSLKEDAEVTNRLLSSLKAERLTLLETNLYLQHQIEFQKMQIKTLSPYQAIKSKMAWGKN